MANENDKNTEHPAHDNKYQRTVEALFDRSAELEEGEKEVDAPAETAKPPG